MLSRRIKQHIKAPLHEFKAGAHIGFESTLAKELSLLGIAECEAQNGAAHFKAKFEHVWQLIALSRCARGFEMKIAEFHCENFGKLEHEIKNIPWELYLPQAAELKIDVKSEKSRLYHKKAIEERFNINFGGKLNVKFKNDVCSIWLDLCGEPLYKRGERWVENAPLQETLAASILLYADFAKYEKLLDPMAGSGVFSLEAAKWRDSHAGLPLRRDFDFMKMPAFREAAFNNFLQKAKQPFATDEKYEILCSDKNPKAVKTMIHNGLQAVRADFFSLPPAENALLVLNPPYGKRIGKEKNLYREIAKKIEKDFSKCKAVVLCPHWENMDGYSCLRTYNGGIKVNLLSNLNFRAVP
jgi:putative N6-adenine-specific DNA methylase